MVDLNKKIRILRGGEQQNSLYFIDLLRSFSIFLKYQFDLVYNGLFLLK